MKKFLLLVSATGCCAASSPALAQEPSDLNEQLIWTAYGKLQADPVYQLTMTGTTTVNGVTKSFNSILYFNLSTDPRTNQQSLSKVELDDYDTSGKTPVLLRRSVGDGGNLWIYDMVQQRYFSTFYSFYGTQRPVSTTTSDAPKMLEQLDSASEGPSEYLIRLLREINQGNVVPRYQTWAPGEVSMQPLSLPPTQDPLVPSREYSTSSAEQWVLYGPPPLSNPKYYKVAPNRSVAFEIDNISGDANNPDWRLTNIFFAERTKSTFTNWTIQIQDASVIVPPPPVPTWAFQPYGISALQGWLPLNVTRHYTG
jgi:hypothetical protein